eukprot:g68147.t1
MVNIGYVFGIFCPKDGGFVVFDTHRKDFSALGFNQSGAYMVLFTSSKGAVTFIEQFVLSSRKEIVHATGGLGPQATVANNLGVAVFSLNPESNPSEETKSQKASHAESITTTTATATATSTATAIATTTTTNNNNNTSATAASSSDASTISSLGIATNHHNR